MSACILPLAPEFQDPLASPNYSPVITGSNPEMGSIVNIMDTQMTARFRVTISDPNVGDDLHVRWVVDYPPRDLMTTTVLVSDRTVPHSADGQPLMEDVFVDVDCGFLLAPLKQHQVMAIVADRPFDTTTGQTNLAKLIDPAGYAVQPSWTLNLECR